MSVLEVIVLLSGTLGVWLTIKENIWCWPASLVCVVLSVYTFYEQRLYGDMALQIIYFFLGIYGWVYWHEKKKEPFGVGRMPLKLAPMFLLITALQTALYYFLLLHFRGDFPLFDAVLTAASLTATYMMTKKWVENWLIWVVIDGTYIILYVLKDLWGLALLYLLFTGMAFYGWRKWHGRDMADP